MSPSTHLILGTSLLVLVFACTAAETSAPTNTTDAGHSELGVRRCNSQELLPFNDASKCFDATPSRVEICTTGTTREASMSIGPACAVDRDARLFVVITRPDLRLEADGFRFGRRHDRSVYTDLEPEALTASELAACERAIDLTIPFQRRPEDLVCGRQRDAAADAAEDAASE